MDTKKETTNSTKRAILRAINLSPPPTPTLQYLDSSLKKNTAYIKRLKTGLHLSDNVQVLIKETQTISLDKYLSEISVAANDGLSKCKNASEIWGAVEVISALHRRFPITFTQPFLQHFTAGLAVPNKQYLASLALDQRDREESARILRQRSLLRCLAEFDLVGLIHPSTAGKTISEGETTFNTLKDLLTADKEALVIPLPLAVSFSKQFTTLYFPSTAPFATTPAEASEARKVEFDEDIIANSVKEKFGKLFRQYFDALGRKAVKDHIKLRETEKRNTEAAIRSGQIFEDRIQAFEKLSKDQEKLWTGIQSLSETLSLTPPTLPEASASSPTNAITGTGPSAFGGVSDLGIWADEEEKKFYEELIDLRDEVPVMLLGLDAPEKKAETSDPVEAEKDEQAKLEEEMEKLAVKDLSLGSDDPLDHPEDDEQEEINQNASAGPVPPLTGEALASGPAARLTALFTRLDDVYGAEAIDRITVEFAYLNSKAARNRLIKHFLSVNKNRMDLLPYFARMTATLSKYMPDMLAGLLSGLKHQLEDEFRYLQRKKSASQDFYALRSKNIRYISELTKFNLTPSHSILHCIKVCVDELTGPNIENLCNLLEGCGRWVLRNERTRDKMTQLLEQMKRKKASQNMDSRQVMMLENAYYQAVECNPPDRPVIEPKIRTPMELFMRYQLYDCLNKKSVDKVIKILRKLHWDTPEVPKILKSILTKVWKIKYGNIYLFAIVVHDLSKYHSDFTVSIIDQVLENVRFGMELNLFKDNQQRIASIKYLGELYNYRVVDSKVIFDTLWSFVTFGHPDGRPSPEMICPIDGPDDFFRVRLICTLLHTCGHCFDRGSLKKRLNNFLTFFIMYLRCKETPPMDVDFLLQDTIEELQPKLNIYLGFEQAVKAVEEMYAATSQGGATEEDKADDDEMGDEDETRDRAEPGDGGDDDLNDDANDGDTVVDGGEGPDGEEDLPRNTVSNAISKEEEEEFARELAKMIAETGGGGTQTGAGGANEAARKNERNPTSSSLFSDQGLPVLKNIFKPGGSGALALAEGDRENEGDKMTFALLTKKGNKQQLKPMQIPSTAPIAIHTRNQQLHDQVEHQHLKRLVLDYEQREEAAERKNMQADLARRGINLKFVND
ncbi:uncharacterized protein MELLADRAFT_90304 [Melampsora larici-populina 98AG31]|uniref:MIF4G domain-containing protein n=1 Tax=Melampsora larici-populina (strain 98AG31 / pathotype 3-4-7) TaxID=747676 RepID=F4RWG5_MELLP|nr:uncharacterized protein MELLADRAFT_90304 [Melampsora larici-populina 98AG31]EGG03325.1 hypothetical protein MELLADRAFT_90304 [Melampsora larici-populina 98AG31]